MIDLTNSDDLLYSLRTDSNDINKKINQLEELRAIATSVTVATDKEAVQSSGSQDKMAKIVAKIVDLEEEINAEIDGYCVRREWVKDILFEIKNENYQNVIYDYFVCNLPLWQVADDYDITLDNAKKRLRRSKKIFEDIFENKKKEKIHDIVYNGK